MSRPCSVGEARQLRRAHHRAVVVDDLAQRAGGTQPGESGEVDGGLGVAGAAQHAAVDGAQRDDVSGAVSSHGSVAESTAP
jgi:hypothetical protein